MSFNDSTPSNLDSNPYAPPPVPLSTTDTWIKALTQPNLAAYEQIANDPHMSIGMDSLWLFISGLFTAFIGIALTAVFNSGVVDTFMEMSGQSDAGSMLTGLMIMALCMIPLAAVMTVVGMMISAAITQFAARLFGGQGSFGQLFHTWAAFTVPLLPFTALINSIPFVNCLSIFLSLFLVYLQVLSIKASNRFGWGQAIGAYLVPLVIIGVVVCCVVVGLLAVLGPAINQTYQEILEQMQQVPMP